MGSPRPPLLLRGAAVMLAVLLCLLSSPRAARAVAASGGGGGGGEKESTCESDIHWAWDNTYTADLPADPEAGNFVRQVANASYSLVDPTPLAAPVLLAVSADAAALLGWGEAETSSPSFLAALSGSQVPLGATPFAHAYGGHQFGDWAGQLGDGRAISLGELEGVRKTRWELQLKGAGKTPYSRSGDGRAVLRSSIREFLASEAMDALGVPTTRALSLVADAGPRSVLRDPFYDGRFANETAAVVARLAPSWVRFGDFELLARRGDLELLGRLVDHVVRRHYPHLPRGAGAAAGLLGQVAGRTGRLVARWMSLGFSNGVLNTDNMSVLGLAIDFGPFGFLDAFDPNSTPNTSDDEGRYRHSEQPKIAQWNLERLAEALSPQLEASGPAATRRALANFTREYAAEWATQCRAKLGLLWTELPSDPALAESLLEAMATAGADFTNTWRALAGLARSGAAGELDAAMAGAGRKWEEWKANYLQRVAADDAAAERMALSPGMAPRVREGKMRTRNPKFILRNWVAQQAIAMAEDGNPSLVRDLLRVLRSPFAEHPDMEEYARPPPPEMRGLKISCSS